MRSLLPQGLPGLILLACTLALKLHAGGSGLNTIVVVNQDSSNSCELGNYYCQQRQVPAQNVLFINWPGGNTSWASNDLQTVLVGPLLNLLAGGQLTNQIQYLVLSMDIPFQTGDASTVDSTTSALFYGLRLGTGSDPLGITNSYAASEAVFGQSGVVGAPGYSFLTTMITGNTLAQAEQLVDQGVASDGTFPQQTTVLAKSSDTLRNIRFVYFDNAIFNVNLLGVSSMIRTNSGSVWWPSTCSGFETGLADFGVPSGLFTPGSVADSLTSFGGIIFGSNSQTNELAFVDAGAAGSYGTVAEPENDTQKFPNPQVYFYQARGFSLAESYYQSVNVPYLGLMVAEPLAAPFARTGSGRWNTNIANAVLCGTTNLYVKFTAADASHPLQQVDLFVDGVYFSTLTNLPPAPGNLLTVTLNGYPVTYTVPANSTPAAIAAGLGAQINAATNSTLVQALVYGDRIQLQAFATNSLLVPYYVPDTTPSNTPGLSYSVSYLPASSPPQMASGAMTKTGAYATEISFPSSLAYSIEASTDLINWQPVLTNSAAGLFNFVDASATNYPRRFYRIAWSTPSPPQLSQPAMAGGGAFQIQVTGATGQAWAVQISTNLVNWITVFTNQLGGATNYVDTGASSSPARFYRAFLASAAPPAFAVLNPATNLTLIRVSDASMPFTVGVATNQSGVTPLATNYAIGEIQLAAGSAAGSGASLSTFLRAAQPAFMNSQAFGLQNYVIISNLPPTNAWIQFTITKTNGQIVVVGVTNQSGANSITLANQLCDAINSNPSLETSDGVAAADFVPIASSVSFNLYAQSPGYQAAGIRVQARTSGVIASAPQGTLTKNLSDLQPRDHIYVTAGATSLAVTFPLATTNLTDGYHQLTAVAYEGSDARTETLATVPVQIQNSPLSATLALLDLTNSAPVEGSYHIQVTANTNNVSLITLFSTGGALGAVSNAPTATFQVAGTNLWAGLHPFYAIVQTSSGLAYRTGPQWVTFVH